MRAVKTASEPGPRAKNTDPSPKLKIPQLERPRVSVHTRSTTNSLKREWREKESSQKV